MHRKAKTALIFKRVLKRVFFGDLFVRYMKI